MDSLEKRLEALERQAAALSERLDRAEDRAALENLMARHQLYCAADAGVRIAQELWCADDAVSLEYGASGVYCAPWKVRTFYESAPLPGRLSVTALTTGSITVAPDGTAARGFWLALGADTDAGELGPCPPAADEQRRFLLTSRAPDGRRYRAEWAWQRYSVRFARENGVWKIHDLHIGEVFRCPFDRDWVRFAEERFATDGMRLEALFESPAPLPKEAHGENMPTAPTTAHWQYTPDADAKEIPLDEFDI